MKKYRVIYADPPWYYNEDKDSSHTYPKYKLMTTEDICALPIKNLSEDNATLFCWATSYRLPEALKVVEAWGFDYKAILAWDKVAYSRGNLELLLVAGKGKSTPSTQKGLPSAAYVERKTIHSVKPEWFATDYIDKFWPDGNRIELFARRARDGWDVWGNEAPGSVEIDAPNNGVK